MANLASVLPARWKASWGRERERVDTKEEEKAHRFDGVSECSPGPTPVWWIEMKHLMAKPTTKPTVILQSDYRFFLFFFFRSNCFLKNKVFFFLNSLDLGLNPTAFSEEGPILATELKIETDWVLKSGISPSSPLHPTNSDLSPASPLLYLLFSFSIQFLGWNVGQ